jgi:AraC family transcriptional regulator of adaptative response / DNA-3-methyladenine glycosylase II
LNARVLKLSYRPPYDWQHVAAFLATRALPGIERVDSGSYSRTVTTLRGQAFICVRPLAAQSALELRVTGAATSDLFQIAATARRMFDLDADPARITLALRSDPLLAPCVKARPGLRIPGAWDPFECAVRAVLGQQVSVAAGCTFAKRIVARLGRALEDGEAGGLTHLFPSAVELAGADLRGVGLTNGRIFALQALARAVASGALDLRVSVEDVTAALAELPGIGDWTAQYVALRALAERDAFPAGDLILRRAASANREPLAAGELHRRSQAWRPFRGYAVFHLWAATARARTAARESKQALR